MDHMLYHVYNGSEQNYQIFKALKTFVVVFLSIQAVLFQCNSS